MATMNLTRGGFLRKVYDYETNPSEWKFIGPRPALIDFYASWCGPCKALAPVIEELGKEYDGKVDVYKVNVDDERELAKLFNVRSIPTLLFIPMEGNPQMSVGAMSKAELSKRLDELVG